LLDHVVHPSRFRGAIALPLGESKICGSLTQWLDILRRAGKIHM
jgi:hypothetical protein